MPGATKKPAASNTPVSRDECRILASAGPPIAYASHMNSGNFPSFLTFFHISRVSYLLNRPERPRGPQTRRAHTHLGSPLSNWLPTPLPKPALDLQTLHGLLPRTLLLLEHLMEGRMFYRALELASPPVLSLPTLVMVPPPRA